VPEFEALEFVQQSLHRCGHAVDVIRDALVADPSGAFQLGQSVLQAVARGLDRPAVRLLAVNFHSAVFGVSLLQAAMQRPVSGVGDCVPARRGPPRAGAADWA